MSLDESESGQKVDLTISHSTSQRMKTHGLLKRVFTSVFLPLVTQLSPRSFCQQVRPLIPSCLMETLDVT